MSILVVDSYEDAATSLVDQLQLQGFGVEVVKSGEDALKHVAKAPPDVVLLELRLPGVDGWEVVRQMRCSSLRKRPLFIAITTCGRVADRRRSTEAGIDLHMVKPVDPAVLCGLLRRFERVVGHETELSQTILSLPEV